MPTINHRIYFGRWVRQQRRLLGLTQDEVARRIICSLSTIQKIEKGYRRPSAQIVGGLAEVLQIPAGERDTFRQFALAEPADEFEPAVNPSLSFPVNGRGAAISPSASRVVTKPETPMLLIDRWEDIGQLCAYVELPTPQLITLVGPPGVGKTSLAQQVMRASAQYFADGVFDLSLAAIRNPDHVAMAIVNALGITPGAYQTPVQCLASHLQKKHLLLVLDNFEHLLQAAPLLADVLAAAPRLKLLITSRAVLHLNGERAFTLRPLALPDLDHLPSLDELAQVPAVALYLERAQAVNQAFRLTRENAPAVAALCARLDGLPLAIELAAARSKLFSPAALLTRITGDQASVTGGRLHLLAHGPRNVTERHQSLANAIQWSYDLLSEAEKTVFAQLAAYTGGCTLSTAEQVCTLPDSGFSLLDILAALVNHHLLQVASEPTGEPRFYMLETIREFALACLNTSGQRRAS